MSTNPLLTPPLEETVYLYSGADEKRLDEYEAEIDDALEAERAGDDAASRRMGSAPTKPRSRQLAEECDAFRAEAKARAIPVLLRGVPRYDPSPERPGLNSLLDQHQPREGDAKDKVQGYNRETFPPALIKACLVSPEVTDEQFAEFLTEASAGRFDRLFAAAQDVTRLDADLPKSSAVSVLDQILAQP